MTKDAPAFDFYPERWLAGVADLSDAEQIAFLRLLCHQWIKQGLPDDVEKLRRLAGKGVTNDLLAKFPQCEDGQRRNKRLETIRNEQRERIAKKSEQRKAAANARWSKNECGSNATASIPHTKPQCGGNAHHPPPTTHPLQPSVVPPSPKASAPSAWNPSDEQKVVAGWFHRRDTTAWSQREITAWKRLSPQLVMEGISSLKSAYTATNGEASIYRRKDLLTLLNNWQGELDRWGRYAGESSDVTPTNRDFFGEGVGK